jgi:transposase
MSRHGSNYPLELRERAVRMVAEIKVDYPSEWAAITVVASKLGIGSSETLRKWVRRAEVDAGERPGITGEERAEIKALKREVAELRRANEILKAASSFFAAELCATRRRVDRGGVRDLSRWAVAAAR